jgi:heptosyltransferase III
MSGISPNSSQNLNILVVRPDRLGDVILSTPVFEVIKRHYPRSELTIMTKEPVTHVLRGLSCVDQLMTYEPEGRHAGFKGFLKLVREFKTKEFRIAVVLQTNWQIAAALFLAGVRYRVGPLAKLHSFLFFNRGVRQRRSQVEMHETDYNLQLLRRLGIRVGTRNVLARAHISDETQARAGAWLKERGWQPGQILVAVHPGMGGSALNWPENHYTDFVRAMLRDGRQVVITAGPTEGNLLERVRKALHPHSDKVIFYSGSDTVDFIGAIFMFADLVVAPSTGPMHLAVALKRPVVTFYPPIRVQSAVRWGPYLADEARASIMVPEVYCGEDYTCRGNLCNYFPCMRSLTVAQAIEQANIQISRAQSSERVNSE